MLLLLCLLNTFVAAQVSGPGQVLSESTVARLRSHISTGTIEEKRAALLDIRNYSSPEASRLALPALTDKNEMVRSTAASSIIFLPKPEAARALLPLLDDKAEFVRREAAYALGEVGDPSATSRLVRLMTRDKVLEARTAAAAALGKLGDVSAVEPLLGVLRTSPKEDDEFLRRSAARSIGQIAQIRETGKTTVLTPQNFLPDKFKDIEGGSGQSGLASATSLLIRVLENDRESDDTRREAAYSLGAIGDPAARAALQRFTTSPDTYLAEICREALLKIEKRNKPTSSDD